VSSISHVQIKQADGLPICTLENVEVNIIINDVRQLAFSEWPKMIICDKKLRVSIFILRVL